MELALLIVVLLILAAICAGTVIVTKRLKKSWMLNTLVYASNQFDRLAQLGAREEMRKLSLSNKDVLAYASNDEAVIQKFLEYVYAFNRIGLCVRQGLLDEDTLFQAWLPSWFSKHWKTLEPLVSAERERRKDVGKALYADFQWLAGFTERLPR